MASIRIEIIYDKETGVINTDGPIDQPLVFLGMLDYARMMVFDNEREKRSKLIKPSKVIDLKGGKLELFKNPGGNGS